MAFWAAPHNVTHRTKQGSVLRKVRSTLIVLLLGLTTAVAVVSVLLTLFLPTVLQRFACTPYGIRCAVGQAKVHPHLNLTFDLAIQYLTVFEQDGRGVVLRAKRAAVTLDLPSLISTRRAMPTEVNIDSPELLVRKLEDGRWNVVALVQEVRQHLRPRKRVTPVQLPPIFLTGGLFQLAGRRVTDVNLSLEPKPAPLLFEVKARATVEGQPVQVTGVVNEALDGEVRTEGQEVMLQGALRPWKPRAAVRFHLDLAARSLSISEWLLEDDAAMARGSATIRYGELPLAYVLKVATWHADFSAVAPKLPFRWLSGLRGQVQGEPSTLEGQWPQLPVARVAATLSGVGFELAKQRFATTGLRGACRLQFTGARVRLQADLRGEAVELPEQRYGNPMINVSLSANPRDGDVALDELRASVSGLRIRAKGSGRHWGRDGVEVSTIELIVEPDILNRLLHRGDRGIAIRAVTNPSIHLIWSGTGHPWSLDIASQSVQAAFPDAGHAVTVQEPKIAIQGVGTSWRDLQGTVASRQVELAGRQLSTFMARFTINPDRVQIPELRFAAGAGRVHGQASFLRSSVLSDLRGAFTVQGLQVRQLFPTLEKSTALSGIAVDAEISTVISEGRVSATIDLPPGVTRQLSRLISQPKEPSPADNAQGHLVFAAQGTLQTTKGLQASGIVTVQGLHALVSGGGSVGTEPPITLPVAYHDGLLSIKVKELGFTAHDLNSVLGRQAAGRIQIGEGRLTISADATLGGSRPPSATGEIGIRGLSLNLARQEADPVSLLRGLQGSVPFILDKGRLAIKETTLRAEGGLNFTVRGSLPLGGNGGEARRFGLTLPWIDASTLSSPLGALAPTRLSSARLAGQIRADLEIIGQESHGTVVLRDVKMESDLLHVDGISGVIPLAGRVERTPATDRTSGPERVGWPHLSEAAYEAALATWRERPAKDQAPYFLSIGSFRYGPIEVRRFEATLVPSGDQIAIERFSFEGWGGRAGGWGMIQPLGGGIALAMFTEGLSLGAICNAFPAIKGYISGRINGLADVFIPLFSLDKAQGKARFWAVESPQERKEISRALIEKLAGQRIRYFSLFGQDRRYDRGVLDVGLKQGDLIFHELDISHTTLGIKDLDIKVSPTFNKIGLAHLLETIREAIERIKAKAKPQSEAAPRLTP